MHHISWIEKFKDKDKNIDLNHIEYIEILEDYIYIYRAFQLSSYYDYEYLKKGDIISIQYLSLEEIEIKLNGLILYISVRGITNDTKTITWHQLYWHNNIHNLNYFRNITKEVNRENKLKKLL